MFIYSIQMYLSLLTGEFATAKQHWNGRQQFNRSTIPVKVLFSVIVVSMRYFYMCKYVMVYLSFASVRFKNLYVSRNEKLLLLLADVGMNWGCCCANLNSFSVILMEELSLKYTL